MEPLKLKINSLLMQKLSKEIYIIEKSFNQKKFLLNHQKELENLELKARVSFVSKRLYEAFNHNEALGLRVFYKLAKKRIITDFELWPMLDYVGTYGLAHFNLSFKNLEVMTCDFTAEYAIRPFIKAEPLRVQEYLKTWVSHPNEHLRRLASEGTRPLLPWGEKLHEINLNPDLTWWILEELKNDPSLYVRKSVANHINDFSKNHSAFILNKIKTWKKPSEETSWIIRHGLRTLLKNGHPEVLRYYGIKNEKISHRDFKILSDSVHLGEALEYEIRILNKSAVEQLVVVDSLVYLLKANKTYTTKCFKGKKVKLAPGESRLVSIKVPFKVVTTRKYHIGTHFLSVQVNGASSKRLSFTLAMTKL